MVTCIGCSDRLRGRCFFSTLFPGPSPGLGLCDAPLRAGLEPGIVQPSVEKGRVEGRKHDFRSGPLGCWQDLDGDVHLL